MQVFDHADSHGARSPAAELFVACLRHSADVSCPRCAPAL